MALRIDHQRPRSSSFMAVAEALREMQDGVVANRTAIGGVLFLCLIAYGFLAFNLTLAGDDWRMVHDNTDHYALFLNLGRWVAVGLWQIFYENRFAPAATLFAALALMTVAAVVSARAIGAVSAAAVFFNAALLVLNPVLAETFSFKINHLATGFGVLWAAMSVALSHTVALDDKPLRHADNIGRLAAASVLLLLATGCQQSLFLFAVTMLLGSILHLFQARPEQARFTSSARRAVLVYPVVLSTALVAYLITTVVVRYVFQLDAGDIKAQYAFSESLVRDPAGLGAALRRFAGYFTQFAFAEQHLWPRGVKWIFLAAFVTYASLLFRLSWAERRFRLPRTLALILVLSGFLVAPWALGLARTPDSYRYTALLGLLPVYPVVFAQTMGLVSRRTLRAGVLLAASWIVYSFLFFQNVAAIATHTSNQRDLAVAGRMLASLEAHPDFGAFADHERQYVFLVGRVTYDFHEDVPFQQRTRGPMGSSIVGCGVFNCQPERFQSLMLFVDYPSGRRYKALDSKDLARAQGASAIARSILAASEWPSPGSVLIVDDRAFIVLQLPEDLRASLLSIAGGA
jgi:hypothetical protein